MRYYHYIVEKIATGERSEIVTRGKPITVGSGYRVIACCGYHDKPNEIKRGGYND